MSYDVLRFIGRRVKDNAEFSFNYISHTGKFSNRRVKATCLWYGKTEFHPDDQWLMDGVDMDKLEVRSFAVRDMSIPDEVLR